MYQRWFVATLVTGLLHTSSYASGESTFPFVDGLWTGGVETGPDNRTLEACWARTAYGDGTTLTLTKRGDGNWSFRVSNPGWHLPPSHRYAMDALVDFYPQLHFAAEATSETALEIDGLEQIALLGLIENGHTIDLASDGFNAKYSLEGSAKVIQRLRSCFAG